MLAQTEINLVNGAAAVVLGFGLLALVAWVDRRYLQKYEEVRAAEEEAGNRAEQPLIDTAVTAETDAVIDELGGAVLGSLTAVSSHTTETIRWREGTGEKDDPPEPLPTMLPARAASADTGAPARTTQDSSARTDGASASTGSTEPGPAGRAPHQRPPKASPSSDAPRPGQPAGAPSAQHLPGEPERRATHGLVHEPPPAGTDLANRGTAGDRVQPVDARMQSPDEPAWQDLPRIARDPAGARGREGHGASARAPTRTSQEPSSHRAGQPSDQPTGGGPSPAPVARPESLGPSSKQAASSAKGQPDRTAAQVPRSSKTGAEPPIDRDARTTSRTPTNSPPSSTATSGPPDAPVRDPGIEVVPEVDSPAVKASRPATRIDLRKATAQPGLEPSEPALPKGAQAALASILEVVPDPRNTIALTRDPTAEVRITRVRHDTTVSSADRGDRKGGTEYQPPAPDEGEWETPKEPAASDRLARKPTHPAVHHS